MTFEELRKKDTENAFIDWYSVKNAKAFGDIEEKYWAYFDNNCECGSENIIRKNRKALMCCNPNCPTKQSYALAEVLSRFGIKGLKAATCKKIYSSFLAKDRSLKKEGKKGILITDSIIAAIAVQWDDYPLDVATTEKGNEYFNACCQIVQDKITFPTLVSRLAIPSLGNSAEQLLYGIDNSVQLIDEIKKEGSVYNFCINRGSYAPMLAFNLKAALLDIVTADMIFSKNRRNTAVWSINVCMTGMIYLHGSKTTKDAYLRKCNDLCSVNDTQLLEIKMNAAKETNSFILYSRESSDAKFVVGERRGTINDIYGVHPVLMHTDTFYEFLEKVVEKWKIATASEQTQPITLQMILQTILNSAMKETLHPELQEESTSPVPEIRAMNQF